MKRFFLALSAMAALTASAFAQDSGTIVLWNFNNGAPLTGNSSNPALAPAEGKGKASTIHATPSVYSVMPGNGSNYSWSSNYWVTGDYYLFEFSTVFKGDIGMTFDMTRSAAGPTKFALEYSLGDNRPSAFTRITEFTVEFVNWLSEDPTEITGHYDFTEELSAITSLDNRNTIFLRLVSLDPAGSSGTSSIDNISITWDEVIPEPSTLAIFLVGIGAVAILWKRRRLA